jgi:heptosyltransferase II
MDEVTPARTARRFDTARVRRLLVKEVNWLGDLVMSLPALRLLRTAFRDAWLAVLIRAELAGFFDGLDWIDEVIPYRTRPGLAGLTDQRAIIGTIRRGRFDLAVMFPNSFISALWPALASVPNRAGYATDARSLLLTRRAVPAADATGGHQSEYWLAMLRDTLDIAGAEAERPQVLEVSPASVARVREWLAGRRRHPGARLVALAAGAAYGPAKQWPEDYFVRLIDRLAEDQGTECVLVGAPAERAKCDSIGGKARAGAIVAAGETTVAELKALLSLCAGFAGNDSGAMHLAAALGIPAVGIFGSTNPARTGPLGGKTAVLYRKIECSPCLQRTCRYGHYQCLRTIEPPEVIAALARLGVFA